ncbi:MAG: hypothetical protein ACT4PV_07460, partial [Planctomycetaceae bacterium]
MRARAYPKTPHHSAGCAGPEPSPHPQPPGRPHRLRVAAAAPPPPTAADASEFEWVVGFERRKPPTMPVTQAIREPALLASAHLARCAV